MLLGGGLGTNLRPRTATNQATNLRLLSHAPRAQRSVKVHAHIIHYLRKQMPAAWGKREKQERLVGRLEHEFAGCARRYGLPRGDFPHVGNFRASLMEV